MKIEFNWKKKWWYFLNIDSQNWKKEESFDIEVEDFERKTFLKDDSTHTIISFIFDWKYWYCHCRNWINWLTCIFDNKNDFEKSIKNTYETYISEKWKLYK
jgi:hypothetical protein